MKKTLIVSILLVFVITWGYTQPVTWDVVDNASWIAAINGIRRGGNDRVHNINLNASVVSPPTTGGENTFGTVTGITVNIVGAFDADTEPFSISLSGNGNLLRIGPGHTIFIRDIALLGREGNTTSLVNIGAGGTLQMEASQTNRNIPGGTYLGDNASYIYWEMVGRTRGRGIWVEGGGTFIMNGGRLANNASDQSGAGIYVVSGGTFVMNGGDIYGNYSLGNGGGVYIASGASFTKTGGIIEGAERGEDSNNAHDPWGYEQRQGAAIYNGNGNRWRNSAIGETEYSDDFGFYLNDENPMHMQGWAW